MTAPQHSEKPRASRRLPVVVAGALVQWRGWTLVDPVASLVIVAAILYTTWGLLFESINLALDAVPREIDPVVVRDYLKSLPGISDVHDLHIWGMSTTETALTVHLVKPDGRIDDTFLTEVEHTLHDRFGRLADSCHLTCFLDQLGNHIANGHAFGARRKGERHAMLQHRLGQRLDVVD